MSQEVVYEFEFSDYGDTVNAVEGKFNRTLSFLHFHQRVTLLVSERVTIKATNKARSLTTHTVSCSHSLPIPLLSLPQLIKHTKQAQALMHTHIHTQTQHTHTRILIPSALSNARTHTHTHTHTHSSLSIARSLLWFSPTIF